jgi:AraC-like DNA-binding protein
MEAANVETAGAQQALLSHRQQLGLDTRESVREAGVAAALHDAPDVHLTRELRLALWRAALMWPADADRHPELVEILEARFAQQRPTQWPMDPMLARVEQLVSEALGSLPQVDKTARRLGMSARTLQRRLRASGTTFSDLLERVLERKARRLLMQRERTLTDIADELGFSEQSAFQRAFKRWTGTTPAQFRAEVLRT